MGRAPDPARVTANRAAPQLGIHWDLAATMRTAMTSAQRLLCTRLAAASAQHGGAWSWPSGRSTRQANLALLRLAQEIDQPSARPHDHRRHRATIARGHGRERTSPRAASNCARPCQRAAPDHDLVVRVTQPAVVDGEKARERAESLLSRQITVTFAGATANAPGPWGARSSPRPSHPARRRGPMASPTGRSISSPTPSPSGSRPSQPRSTGR